MDILTSINESNPPFKSHLFDSEEFTLKVVDQLRLPHFTNYVSVETIEDGYDVIKQMKVRGAPLIATVGMLSLLVDLRHNIHIDDLSEFVQLLDQKLDHIVSARPTAVNLVNISSHLKEHIRETIILNDCDCKTLKKSIERFVLEWQGHEKSQNAMLIKNSIESLDRMRKNLRKEKLVVMTLCNTGSLATSSFGTALGVIVHLHRFGMLEFAIVLETRPYNQGSRLTACELLANSVPFRLIADNAAASAMKHLRVDAILVGADRVALNGDTANKIGTYSLAVLAKYHNIPFFVITPTLSICSNTKSGKEISVEERPEIELTHFNDIPICPPNTPVWNPAFDITPNSLITEILTEKGNFLQSIESLK